MKKALMVALLVVGFNASAAQKEVFEYMEDSIAVATCGIKEKKAPMAKFDYGIRGGAWVKVLDIRKSGTYDFQYLIESHIPGKYQWVDNTSFERVRCDKNTTK